MADAPERNKSIREERINEILIFLGERLLDLRTLNVITASGNFQVVPLNDKKDLVDALNVNPTNINILAKTQIQIDGDRVNVLPVGDAGSVTQKEILEFHEKAVTAAELAWKNRLEMIRDLILKIPTIFGKGSLNVT